MELGINRWQPGGHRQRYLVLTDPAKLTVFDLLYGCGTAQQDGTWDPTAVHYAIYGTADALHHAGAGGHNTVTADGINRWQPGGHRQRYLVLTDPAKLSSQIDSLINRRPLR